MAFLSEHQHLHTSRAALPPYTKSLTTSLLRHPAQGSSIDGNLPCNPGYNQTCDGGEPHEGVFPKQTKEIRNFVSGRRLFLSSSIPDRLPAKHPTPATTPVVVSQAPWVFLVSLPLSDVVLQLLEPPRHSSSLLAITKQMQALRKTCLFLNIVIFERCWLVCCCVMVDRNVVLLDLRLEGGLKGGRRLSTSACDMQDQPGRTARSDHSDAIN